MKQHEWNEIVKELICACCKCAFCALILKELFGVNGAQLSAIFRYF